MKDSALSVGLIEGKMNYAHNARFVQYEVYMFCVCGYILCVMIFCRPRYTYYESGTYPN
jgi:hypothetical protein